MVLLCIYGFIALFLIFCFGVGIFYCSQVAGAFPSFFINVGVPSGTKFKATQDFLPYCSEKLQSWFCGDANEKVDHVAPTAAHLPCQHPARFPLLHHLILQYNPSDLLKYVIQVSVYNKCEDINTTTLNVQVSEMTQMYHA